MKDRSDASNNSMSAVVSLEELLAAYEWVSAGEEMASECEAYVSRATGKVHWSGDGVEEELPEDIEDGSLYVAVPQKSDLDLGLPLVLRFVRERLPGSFETVREYFRNRGAYSRFKSMLERVDQLQAWHEYERVATETALREWSSENGFILSGGSIGPSA